MKKTTFGLTLALLTNVAAANDAGLKSRVYTAVATGVHNTGAFVSHHISKGTELVGKLPGATFVSNNKRNLILATAVVYSGAELYNWKKGKELRTTKVLNWSAQTRLGKLTKTAWNSSTSWLVEKYHAWILQLDSFKAEVADLKKQVNALNTLDTTNLVTRNELDAVSQQITSVSGDITDIQVAIANIKKTINEFNIDIIRKNISDLQSTSVKKDAFTQSQKDSVALFVTQADLKDLAIKIDCVSQTLANITETLKNAAPKPVQPDQTSAPTTQPTVTQNVDVQPTPVTEVSGN